ncbi:unnamed protein product, partial [Timema podura]|nr:unnamed protein product [Timema podura]
DGVSSKEIVSVAVEVSSRKELKKFPTNQPLHDIVKQLCEEFQLPYETDKYSLQLTEAERNSQRNKYLTEDNRDQIKDGCILKLVFSPSEMVSSRALTRGIVSNRALTRGMVKMFLPKILSQDEDKRTWALEKLALLSHDPVFLSEFVSAEGVPALTSLVCEPSLTAQHASCCLKTLLGILSRRLVTTVDEAAIKRIVQTLWMILRAVVTNRKSGDEGSSCVERKLGVPDVIHHLWNRDNPRIQQNTVGLINALAGGARGERILQYMVAARYRDTIHKNIILNPPVSEGMAHELYVYQTLILNLREAKLRTPVDATGMDQKLVEDLNSLVVHAEKDIRRYSVNIFASADPQTTEELQGSNKTVSMMELDNSTPMMGGKQPRKLIYHRSKSTPEFESQNYAMDFSSGLFCQLTVEFMLYFAQRYMKTFVRVMLEDVTLGHSFPAVCERVTRLVCEVVGLGRPPRKEGRLYQPLVFQPNLGVHFLEEVFCRTVLLLGRTRRDMKARTAEDEEKVFTVLRRQLLEALATKAESVTKLDEALRKVTYGRVSELWELEREKKERHLLESCPPILELRNNRTPDMVQLIKEQRLEMLMEGHKFPVINQRGQGKFLNRFQKIQVSNVTNLVTGKKCPHVKDFRKHKLEQEILDLSFSLILDCEPHSLDLVAPNQAIFDCWVDGFNALLGRDMTSNAMMDDLKVLLDMEVRLLLLDIEGIQIPNKPPPVPQPPPNYHFHDESNA